MDDRQPILKRTDPPASVQSAAATPSEQDLDEAGMESFPASDPPSFTGSAASPSQKSPPRIMVPPSEKPK